MPRVGYKREAWARGGRDGARPARRSDARRRGARRRGARRKDACGRTKRNGQRYVGKVAKDVVVCQRLQRRGRGCSQPPVLPHAQGKSCVAPICAHQNQQHDKVGDAVVRLLCRQRCRPECEKAKQCRGKGVKHKVRPTVLIANEKVEEVIAVLVAVGVENGGHEERGCFAADGGPEPKGQHTLRCSGSEAPCGRYGDPERFCGAMKGKKGKG